MIDRRIDERINELSGLWSCCANKQVGRRRGRAANLSEEQIVDLVLGEDTLAMGESDFTQPSIPENMHSTSENIAITTTNNNIHHQNLSIMKELQTTYQKRRQEVRTMANTYLDRNRNDRLLLWPPDIAAPRNNHPPDDVLIDLHGRLVRRRPEAENPRHGAGDSNNHHDDEKLVDAADAFWKYQSLAEIQRKVHTNTPLTREERHSLQSAATDTTTDHIPNPPRLAPLPLRQAQGPQQVTEQMERDARNAIERALERYQRQSNANTRINNAEDDRVFELIPIPMVRRENGGNNETRWFGAFRRRNPNDANNPPFDMNNHHPAGIDHNNRPQPGWIDIRLAFRRICLAVLTVTAAFICTMLQSIPDLGDDVVYVNGIEVNSLWFAGLLGPHFTGHHPSRRRSVRPGVVRRMFDYPRLIKEGDFKMEGEVSGLEQFLNELFEEEEHEEDGQIDSDGQDDDPMECTESHEYV